jgi:hypothetical protein
METAILAVVVIGFCALALHVSRSTRLILATIRDTDQRLRDETLDSIGNLVIEIRDVLTEASKIKAAKEEKIARATVPPATPKGFVPIARRRAMAERVVSAPAEHRAQVVANNARAIEGA